jgi:aminopeptidase N
LKEIQPYENDDGVKRFIFEKTPIMSTYLLAFVVGNYGSLSGTLHNGASITVYTPLMKEHMGEFCLDVSLMNYVLPL